LTIDSGLGSDCTIRNQNETETMLDLNQDVWDRLREQGHVIGAPHIQNGRGLFIVVDSVAMPIKDARALAHGRVTLAQIKERLNQA
jgi:hypothetical protein